MAQLGSLYRDPRVVTGSASNVPVCLDLLAKSDVVHIACHGTFRTDTPMFSALRLADGQLVVYDFEPLDRLPEVVVMSACSVANSKAVQGGVGDVGCVRGGRFVTAALWVSVPGPSAHMC